MLGRGWCIQSRPGTHLEHKAHSEGPEDGDDVA
jgi:hypothetical protein